MPSVNAMTIMIGAAAGGIGAGMLGRKHAAKDPSMDKQDRTAFTASSVVAGIVAGIAGGSAIAMIGPGRAAKGAASMAKGALGSVARGAKNATMRVFGHGPEVEEAGIGIARKLGAGKAPWLKGPMKWLGFTAATVGVMAYGARSKVPTAAYASRNEAGETEYSSVKQRMDMMGASGEMVFGMNNMRHG